MINDVKIISFPLPMGWDEKSALNEHGTQLLANWDSIYLIIKTAVSLIST